MKKKVHIKIISDDSINLVIINKQNYGRKSIIIF